MRNIKDIAYFFPGFLIAAYFLGVAGVNCFFGLLFPSIMMYVIAILCIIANIIWWCVLLLRKILDELRKLNYQIKKVRKEVKNGASTA